MLDKDYIIQGDTFLVLPDATDNSVDLIILDPPYAMTKNKWDTKIDFDVLFKELERILKPTGTILLFCAQKFIFELASCEFVRKNFKYKYVWEKSISTGFLNAKKQPLRKHEDIMVLYKKNNTYNPQRTPVLHEPKYTSSNNQNTGSYNHIKEGAVYKDDGSRYIPDVLKFDSIGRGFHPTQKPIALLEHLIKVHSNEDDVILDPFAGGGSSFIAAYNLNRQIWGIEKDAKYVDIIKERLEELKS